RFSDIAARRPPLLGEVEQQLSERGRTNVWREVTSPTHLRPLAVMSADRLPPRGMFIVPHGAPGGYEWFVALVVLVGRCSAVCALCGTPSRPGGLRRERHDLPAPNPVHPGPGPDERLRELQRRFHPVQPRKGPPPNPWRKRPHPKPWGTPNPWGKGPLAETNAVILHTDARAVRHRRVAGRLEPRRSWA